MIDKTLEKCAELCKGMLSDYRDRIEKALMQLPDEEGRLNVSMNFGIKPLDTWRNKVTASISFTAEKIMDKRTEEVHEVQLEMHFKEDKKAAGGDR